MMIFPREEPEEIITYKTSKYKAKREAILSAFLSEEVHHKLSEAEQICSECQHQLKEIGSWTVRKN